MNTIPRDAILAELDKLEGSYGVYVEDLHSGDLLEINPELVLPSASIIKVPMLALLLKDAADGLVDLSEPQVIAENNRVGGTGILYELDRDYCPTLYTAGKLMVVLSDNTCTNHIMDLIGIERFNAFWAEQGYPSFRLMRKTMDWAEIAKGKNNFLHVRDAGRLLSTIARRELFSPEICDIIMEIMRKQYYNDLLPALIPAVPGYAPPEQHEHIAEGCVGVAHKTGGLPRLQHDAGIFTLPDGRQYVIAMLTANLKRDVDGAEAIRRVSRLVYEALC